MKIISTPRRMKLFWQLAKQWFTQQFEAVASSIDFTEVEEKIDDVKDDVADVKSAVENIDFSTLATEANATANKEAIISAINSAQPDLTSVAKEATLGTSSDAATASTVFGKLAAILAAFSNIDIDTSALAQRTDVKDGNDTAISMLKDETTGLAAIKEAIGSGGGSQALEQFFGLADSYEAEAKGGERTNNTVIDECKVRFQEAFNGLLPTGFTMPNSVTVDNLTYTGTTNS